MQTLPDLLADFTSAYESSKLNILFSKLLRAATLVLQSQMSLPLVQCKNGGMKGGLGYI